MRVAIQGCSHGELDNIYATLLAAPRAIDVLICCGDFQSFRNPADLHTFAAPEKYRQLGDFWRYYNGEKVAPVLTLFVGGNHEASAFLTELYHGGWVAPNIYFLGVAGSVILRKTFHASVDGAGPSTSEIRISGASGIFKSHDYRTGHHERLPYDNSTLRSVYHIREYDVARLSQLARFRRRPVDGEEQTVSSVDGSGRPDIFVSHDWPQGIEQAGDAGWLVRTKPFFRQEVQTNTLGSPPLLSLLRTLKPRYWFSAHLHVRFAAIWRHDVDRKGLREAAARSRAAPPPVQQKNPDEVEIDLDDDEDETDAAQVKNDEEIEIDDDDEEASGEPGGGVNGDSEMKEGDALPGTPPRATVDESVDAPAALASRKRKASASPVREAGDLSMEGVTANGTEAAAAVGEPDVAATADAEELGLETRFLALDKCLPGKGFMQILEIDPDGQSPPAEPDAPSSITLHHDPLWLGVVRALDPYLPLSKHPSSNPTLPKPDDLAALVAKEVEWVKSNLPEGGKAQIGADEDGLGFVRTAKAVGEEGADGAGQPSEYRSPQTSRFCTMLGIEDRIGQRVE